MREYKFRGKFLDDTSEWLYGNYVYIEDDVFHHKIADKSGLLLDIDINTIGQYTGLKDKNGKEIYEGDIVYIAAEDERGIIRWDNETARYVVIYDNIITDFDNWYGEDLEVIGNIYDNPELLEEGE